MFIILKKYIIKLSKKYGKSLAQIALNWIVNKKNILPIPKFSTFEHFQEISDSDFEIDQHDFEYINDNAILKDFSSKFRYLAYERICPMKKTTLM